MKQWQSSHIVGSPDTVRAALEDLQTRTDADELMITSMIHDPEARRRSYDLVAKAVDLPRR